MRPAPFARRSALLTPARPGGYLREVAALRVNRPLVVLGVVVYSLLVAVLRRLGVIGTAGTLILFAVMVADLAATHWLLNRRDAKL